MILLGNPELIRNARAQLRRGRMLAAAVICGALSLAVGYALAVTMRPPAGPPGEWARVFLKLVLDGQAVALVLGGGIACLHSIHREKDLNSSISSGSRG